MFPLNIGSAKRALLNFVQVLPNALFVEAVTAPQGRNVLSKILEANRARRSLVTEQKAPLKQNIFLLVHRFFRIFK